MTLKSLRTQLEQSAPDIDQKLCRRSAYNFIYGVSLFVFLKNKGLLEVPKGKAKTRIDKMKLAIQAVQNQFPEFYYVDLPDYDLDDYTIRFDDEVMAEVAQETMKITKDIPQDEFFETHEEFFIDSF